MKTTYLKPLLPLRDIVIFPSMVVPLFVGRDKSIKALQEVAKKAISKKTGARGLRSILENILLKTMFELPDMENVIKVTVDKSSVKGDSEPIVTYGKKSSTSVA